MGQGLRALASVGTYILLPPHLSGIQHSGPGPCLSPHPHPCPATAVAFCNTPSERVCVCVCVCQGVLGCVGTCMRGLDWRMSHYALGQNKEASVSALHWQGHSEFGGQLSRAFFCPPSILVPSSPWQEGCNALGPALLLSLGAGPMERRDCFPISGQGPTFSFHTGPHRLFS